MPLAITPTYSPWTHTSDDSYIYQLSLVLATAIVSYIIYFEQYIIVYSYSNPADYQVLFTFNIILLVQLGRR